MLDKENLINEIAAVNGITKTLAEQSLNYTIAGLSSAIIYRGGVRIRDFGTFDIKQRAPRKGRNPRTGEEIDIPAYESIAFSAGKQLKDSLKLRGIQWKN